MVTMEIPVDEIRAQARQAKPGRVLAALFLGIFFLVGWVMGKLWFGLTDCFVAVRVGYRRGRGLPPAENPQE